MGFISRLLGRHQDGVSSRAVAPPGSKRQQPSSPQSGTFSPECWTGRSSPSPAAVKMQSVAATDADMDSDDDETTSIRVPGSLSGADPQRSCSLGTRRRAAIDISPAAVQRLADKVAILEAADLRASLDGDGGITHKDVDALYSDMQLIHRGRSSMVYRARELRTGQRIILKAYDAARLTPAKRTALDRQLRALRAAQAVCGLHDGVVVLERVVQNAAGTYLVMQACNGGTLIEAVANGGGKLPERQVGVKVAAPLLRTLARLHASGIVHRDIKPEHLMIHNGTIKIGDFGAAGLMHGVPPPGAAHDSSSFFLGTGEHKPNKQQQQQHTPVRLAVVAACSEAPAAPAADGGSGSFSGGNPALGSRDAMNFRTGSIEYMAPEMLDKPTAAEVFHLVIAQGIDEDDLPSYDTQVDVWSLGVVVYEALSGLQPFLADSAADMSAVIATKLAQPASQQQQQQQQFHHQQQRQQYPAFIDRLHVSNECKDFVAACLTRDPRQRPTAEQLLQHPWLRIMQEQAAAAAASRAASRRTSMQQPPLPGGGRQVVTANGAFASSSFFAPAGAAAPAQAACAAAQASRDSSSGPLIDPLLASTLLNLPAHIAGGDAAAAVRQQGSEDSQEGIRLQRTATGLLEGTDALTRSQTTTNFEVGLQSVLRTNTQRLDAKAAVRTRVFGM